MLDCGSHHGVELKEVDGEVVGTFDSVATSGIFVERLHELSVDAYESGNDGHDVLGKRISLVGADDGSIGHGFAGAEDTDEKLLVSHTFCGESKSDGERKTYVFTSE